MFKEGGQLPKLQNGKKLPELETYRKFEASADNTKTVAANNKAPAAAAWAAACSWSALRTVMFKCLIIKKL